MSPIVNGIANMNVGLCFSKADLKIDPESNGKIFFFNLKEFAD